MFIVCSDATGSDHRSWRQWPGDLSPADWASAQQSGSGRWYQSQIGVEAQISPAVSVDSQKSSWHVKRWCDLAGSDCVLSGLWWDEEGVSVITEPFQEVVFPWLWVKTVAKILCSHFWPWCPVLCLTGTTADRFYRIDRAQVGTSSDNHHYKVMFLDSQWPWFLRTGGICSNGSSTKTK